MSDLISRSKLQLAIKRSPAIMDKGKHYVRLDAVLGKLLVAPAVDAVPVVHARWVFDRPYHYKCSACNNMWSSVAMVMSYCPNCGAKMDGGAEDD